MDSRSKLTLNTSAVVAQPKLQSLHFNIDTTAKVRHDTMEGKDFLVVPCVMMTEGVHAGSQGPLYYPSEELGKTPAVWNTKPVVVYHPEINGAGVSACDPDILSNRKIGVLMNTRFDDNKLKTECWLDENRMKEVDDRIPKAIEEGSMIEVSTGLFTDHENTDGDWNGEHYDAIARNYRPDHLAILPDIKGACSIEDGAGLLRNTEGNSPLALLTKSHVAVINELSHSEIWTKLNDAIRTSKDFDTWVDEVYDDFFIYHKVEKLFYQKYTMKEDESVVLEGIPQEVERVVQFQLSDGSFVGNKEENEMDKKKFIEDLISNSDWTEEDRELLDGMTEDQLKRLVKNEDEEKVEEPKVEEAPKVEEPKVEEPKVEEAPAENMTAEQYVSNAPGEIRDMLASGLAAHKAEKALLVQAITANERNAFTLDMLNAKSVEELKALAQLATPAAKAPEVPAPHFGGLAPVAPVDNAATEEPLVAPGLSFEKK